MTHLSSLPFAAATDSTDEKFKHTLLLLAETEPHKNCPGGPRTATTRCQNTTRSRLQSPVLPERLRQRRWILTHTPPPHTHTRTQVRQESEQLLPALKARLGTNEPTFTDVTPSRLSRSLRLRVCPPTCARAAHTLGRQVRGGRDGTGRREREREFLGTVSSCLVAFPPSLHTPVPMPSVLSSKPRERQEAGGGFATVRSADGTGRGIGRESQPDQSVCGFC